MSLVLQSSGGGSVTLQEPTTASNYTITVPASTATMAINGPAFSAYMSANQNISSNVSTKITFDTEEFDTANAFDTTNYRFTPQVAGYYQITGTMYPNSTTSFTAVVIAKNGSNIKAIQSTGLNVGPLVTALVYMNGSTDYVELYGYITGTSPQIYASSNYTWFNGALVRAA